MGAWDYGIFDDDTAYDFTSEITTDARAFFIESFENAIQTDYLEYDEAHAVTVSAAYLDNLLNKTQYRTDAADEGDESNVNIFYQINPTLQVEDLKPMAIQALQKVIAPDCHLYELWEENTELFPLWKQNIQDLINRLQ
ncbi:DUF4259 domain-containing protein [Myroides sp. M-43]|uniref:DUF4259 domain-containing protein n=1 Tax=Myroides oncorhynchi TaxID=2893756 RepID=UPI001E3B8022|nr:DUF4259 domain-containing protein [Myroides oncorhynchi]MCC9041527.1 DUF4259 domain-containing protein [Myroides oncorhynchi]